MYSIPSYDDVWERKYQTVLPSLSIQKNAEGSRLYSGVGFISFVDHVWDFQASCSGGLTTDVMNQLANLRPSLVVGSEDHFTLWGETATTAPMLCQDCYPNLSHRSEGVTNFADSLSYVVFGEECEKWRGGNVIKATFHDLNSWNNRLKIKKDELGRLEVPDWCKCSWGDTEFHIIPLKDRLVLRLSNTQLAFEDIASTHLQDVACYCFGLMQSLRTYESIEYRNDDRVRRIAHFSEGGSKKRSARTPLQSKRHCDQKKDSFRHAFKFMQYCVSNSDESDQLMSHVENVYRAISVSPSLAALSLCVAIEWMATKWCPSQLCEAVSEEVTNQIRLCISWDELGLENTQRMKDRFDGLLGLWKTPSAKDRLRVLVQRSVISPEQLKTWDDVRHGSAHGGLPVLDYDHAQQMGELHDLMHSFIAWRIGYSGPLAQYSVDGFPARTYTGPAYPLQ